ncbi:hypothetical protein D0C36_09665 [Mucilaginibacter conchicola]|uniref:Lipocalin-like domain-containing protein n=1 Tax=Mucilaginibacter conchicola TaxID=2303333 RepID=A0A372NR40_9SPHI|nr:hypothetical protein D0C36_09665 [Mucilaginibacter conchicola]
MAFVFAFAACNKNDAPKPESGNIVGTWELRLFTTGWTMPKNYDAGNGNKYTFKADGSYTKYTQNKIEIQGKYTLTPTGEDNGTKFGKIKLTNPDYEDVYSIRTDTFTVGTSVADGPSWQYIRIK